MKQPLTEKDVASTRIGSIVVSLLVFFICVRLILVQWPGVLRTCQQRSYVLYAICSELAPTHMSSPSSQWQNSVSSFAVACLDIFTLFSTDFCTVLGSVCFSLLFLYLWVAKAFSSSSVYSIKMSAVVAHVLFLIFSHKFCI